MLGYQGRARQKRSLLQGLLRLWCSNPRKVRSSKHADAVAADSCTRSSCFKRLVVVLLLQLVLPQLLSRGSSPCFEPGNPIIVATGWLNSRRRRLCYSPSYPLLVIVHVVDQGRLRT